MKPERDLEQRRSFRVHVDGVAMVGPRTGPAGRYSIEDVSLGGLCVRGGPRLAVGAAVSGTLCVPGMPPIPWRGRVVRVEDDRRAAAVEFGALPGDSEDLIHDVALRALERIPIAAVIVVHRIPEVRHALSRSLRELGHRVIVAATPLEVLTWLATPATPIATVVVDIDLGLVPTHHLLRFIADTYPCIRRYVVADDDTLALAEMEVDQGNAEAMLRSPWLAPSSLALVSTSAPRLN